MSHQSEIEKKKYRNWVKGGLAYKYLKQGLDGFSDDVVKQEQSRILNSINCTPGTICNQCIIERLRPIHACITNSAGNYECYWGQRKCNCLHLKKKKCRLKVCDFIMEEILKSHGSTPPTPNWANTDIQKWCTEPWEVAKCFINAPGYSDKTKAADIDISGLLHVFINNTSLHSHLACSMAGKNIFIKVRERRNKLFHSVSMETEEVEVAECIDDIVEILEDTKELRGRPEALEAVNKLKQLKESKFVITTNDEADVCKEAIMCVTQKAEELKQMIEEVKDFNERVHNLETNMSEKVEELTTDLCKRIGKVESDVSVLKSDVSAVTERVTSLEGTVRELDSKRDIYKRHLDYVKGKQELQAQLVKYYKKHFVKTSLSPLKQQQDTINIKDVYVTPEIEVIEEEKCVNIDKNTTEKPGKRYIQRYHDIFQTKGQRNKKIYILGDVGTGKSTFCKMMIENWCNAVSGRTNESAGNENNLERSETNSSDINMANEFDDVYQMGQYEFLFFIQLQYMSVLKTDVTVDMIKELTRDLTSDKDLVDRIFQEDSMRCLIIIDSLDEWTPPKDVVRKPHVSYGIPNGDRAKDATVLTLSRPSAKGILNLKNSEIDLQSHLLGLSCSLLKSFIEKYISQTASTQKSYNEFISIMKKKQICHIEKTPLLLQQILWLYCNDMELGKSVSETYCQILNIMCGWSNHKNDGNDVRNDAIGDKNIFLPENLQIYPRFRNNKRVLFQMGAAAFGVLTSGSIRNIFGRQHLLEKGLSVNDVTKLLQFGILNESNCFDPTQEDTQFSFIHMSYLEFFAALYVTSNENIKETKCLREEEYEKQDVLEKFFGSCKSASDILQLSNVIKMVCGLSPILIGDLSKRILCIMNEDTHILHLRRHWYKTFYRNDEIIQIQRLMVECLKECGSFDKTTISISDLCINDIEPSPSLQRINTNDVISLNVEETLHKNILDYIKQCKHLQHICIKYASFNSMEEISFLSQQVSVKQITLHAVDVLDTHSLQHEIDLSKQEHLQILELFSCDNIRISDLPTQQLEFVHIDDCPGILDFEHLEKANRLTELYIENSNVDLVSRHERHKIDLSTNNHLKTLKLIKCHDMLVTGFSTEQLEKMYIKDMPYTLDFELLSNASRLTELYIENCAVDSQSQHARHEIDLSRQNHLQTVIMLDCHEIVITDINTEQLEQTYIRGCKYALGNINLLSYSRKDMELHVKGITSNMAILRPLLQQTTLRQVTLDNVKCDQEKDLHIDLSGQNHLQKLTLVESPGIVITGLNTEQFEHLHIDNSNPFLRSHATLPALESERSSSARKLIELHLCGQTVNTKTLELLQQRTLRQLNMIHLSGDQHDIHVDLSKLNYLQILKLSDCENIKVSGLNTEQLELVQIINCLCVFDFDLSSNANKLSEIHLEGLTGNMTSLVSLVEHASLRHLTLKGVTHCQSEDEGQMREIHVDLSKQNHLQIVKLSDCQQIKIIDLNIEELKEVHISKCKCLFDFDVLSNASKLSEIHLEGLTINMASLVSLVEHASLSQLTLKGVTHCQPDVEGQTHEIPVDLSKQNHLQIFNMSDCKNMKIIGLNIEELTLIDLSKENFFLRQLTFEDVTHYQAECEGYTHEIHVDLSKQDHLQICTMLDCHNRNKSYLNTENFVWSQHENSPGILKIELSGNAKGLTKFIFTGQVLGERYQFRNQRGNVMHTLHRLTTLNLHNVDMGANALTLIPEMVFLTYILLENTKMSIDTWCAFVDSLLTLQQSVMVDTTLDYALFFANTEDEMKYHFVKDNPLFKLTRDDGALCFCFQRREPEQRP